MEVTKSNFAEKLPCIEKAIEEADFLAIDGEFTGLQANNEHRNSPLDTAAERYAKNAQNVNKFLLVQFGLCTFHYDVKKKAFTNRAFNFYVWPRPYNRSAPDVRFMCQTSSIDFLIQQNFDFNKLFKDGIPYLRPNDELKIKDIISERQNLRQTQQTTPNGSTFVVLDKDKEFIEEIYKKVETWLENPSEQELLLEGYNGFQRRLIYNTVKPKFSSEHCFHMETVVPKDKSERDRSIKLSKVQADEQAKLEQERQQKEFDDLNAAVGFSKVIRKISDSQKLVVGHNMLLDILYTIQQFVAPLPEDCDEFKEVMKSALPQVIDTKLIASSSPLKEDFPGTSLEELHKILEIPKVASAPEHPGYDQVDNEKYHEAGYDAYVTGLCLIGLNNRLAKIAKKDHNNLGLNPDLLSPFVNKVNLHRILDIPYLNVAGPDIQPDRDHVFHITFPPAWKTTEIIQLFAPFGAVQVSWINDTEAYVSLREYVKNAKTVIVNTLNNSSFYKVVPYEIHKKVEQQQSLVSATGITPMLEHAKPFLVAATPTPENTKKRSASPEPEPFKRSKSVSEDKDKLFGDVSWD